MQSAQIVEQVDPSGISSCPTLGTTRTSYVNNVASLEVFYSGLLINVERCVLCVASQDSGSSQGVSCALLSRFRQLRRMHHSTRHPCRQPRCPMRDRPPIPAPIVALSHTRYVGGVTPVSLPQE